MASPSVEFARPFSDDGDKDKDDPLVIKRRGKSILLRTSNLSRYLDALLPRSLQEEAFHRGAQMLRNELCLFDDAFPVLFCLLWRNRFHHLDLPLIADKEDRVSVLEFLTSDSASNEERGKIVSAKFRLFETSDLDIQESYLMKRILRTFANLRVLVLWWACDDQMLNIVGETCRQLEALDVWRSAAVTDLGLKMLLSSGFDKGGCYETLVRLGVKETSCTHLGCMVAIIRCKKLEVLTFSHTAVVKDFFSEVRNMDEKHRTYSLKSLFLPVTNGASFKEIIKAFPELEDLRLWTSVPQLREVEAADFPKLQSLLLGGLHNNRILTDLVHSVGGQLTTLKIETVLADIPLQVIGRNCVNLTELQIVNGRVVIRDHDCREEEEEDGRFFSKLRLLYFFLVQYVIRDEDDENDANVNNNNGLEHQNRPVSALHCLLKHATNIEAVQTPGCSAFTDDSLKEVIYYIHSNPLITNHSGEAKNSQ